MKVYVLLLLQGGLPDEVRVFTNPARARRALAKVEKRIWGSKPPKDGHDDKHDLYLLRKELERR